MISVLSFLLVLVELSVSISAILALTIVFPVVSRSECSVKLISMKLISIKKIRSTKG